MYHHSIFCSHMFLIIIILLCYRSLQGLINTCKFEGMGLYFWQGHVNDLEPFQGGFTP